MPSPISSFQDLNSKTATNQLSCCRFPIHFCCLYTRNQYIAISYSDHYIEKKLFARLHNKYEFLIITLTLTTMFCFLTVLIWFISIFFYLLSLFLLPEVTLFRRPIVPNGSTVPPFHRTGTCYLQVQRISTWSNLARSHLIRSTMLPLAPCWLMYSLTD